MTFHVIIPARYDSKRLPGKVLLPLKGKTILQWVYERAIKSGADSVTIATDDERILNVVQEFGGKSVLTLSTHESGSDRIAEAARVLQLMNNEIIVNVQADEPFIPVSAILQVAENCKNSNSPVATLCKPIENWEKIQDINAVKVVFNKHKEALYFSRSEIPYLRTDGSSAIKDQKYLHLYHHHVGIYAYRAHFLQEYVSWGPCDIELAERLEQLRVLWHGYKIHVDLAHEVPPGDINTIEDFEAAVKGKY